ncbi:MAG: hypothetical protein AAF682_17575 [Planctomycetota bacterium]
MSARIRRTLRDASVLGPALFAAAFAVSCSGSGSDDDNNSFLVRVADHATDATANQVVSGNWMVYFADEAASGSTDLNLDGDAADDVAVAINMKNTKDNVLRAAIDAAIVGAQVYLVVDEAEDGIDWDGDLALDDLVLLHWSLAADVVTFVDLLDPNSGLGTPLLALDNQRVYYAASVVPSGDETTLRYVDEADPLVPVVVENTLGGGPLAPLLLGQEEGLIFLVLDETSGPGPLFPGPPTPDYNLDGDNTDSACLALLDGTQDDSVVVQVPLAMSDAGAPVAACRNTTQSEWLVAFLVNEAAQGATNLNDAALFVNALVPDSCSGTPDLDTDDDVLHYLRYEELVMGTPAVNTGLAGQDRVLVVPDYAATLSAELDATCDFNEDGDSDDIVVRWVEAIDATVDDVMPPRDPSQLFAAYDVPGGSFGVSALLERLVMVVDEAADSSDINGDGDSDDTLVGYLDPIDGFTADWDFEHPTGNPGIGLGPTAGNYAGVNWMAAEQSEGRLGMALMEETFGISVNVDLFCDFEEKDTDAIDSLPIWADFESGPILDFDGQGYALLESDPGIVQARGFVFFRVSESADAFDYNNDGDTNDVILMRNPQAQCSTVAMATASSLGGDNPVIVTDGAQGAVFISSEFQAGEDFNGDGDVNDLVPRYFVF